MPAPTRLGVAIVGLYGVEVAALDGEDAIAHRRPPIEITGATVAVARRGVTGAIFSRSGASSAARAANRATCNE